MCYFYTLETGLILFSNSSSQPDWTVILSDAALDVKCFSVEEGPSLFLVLGKWYGLMSA